MSIIQSVTYSKEDSKPLIDKFGEHLGVHKLKITLKGGESIEGIVSEVGKDYISIIEDNCDTIIPLNNILFFRYER